MARLLFAAHDPGGALMIGAAARELERRGHAARYVAAGPAAKLWQGEGHAVVECGAEDFAAPDGPVADAVVAGTGFGAFERAAWQWARRTGLRSLAGIDSWTHLMRRFETPQGVDFPDVVALIDEDLAADFRAAAGNGVETAVVGQPHLEAQTARLRRARAAYRRSAGKTTLAFFSEPIIEDFGAQARGFDQFQVFEIAVAALTRSAAAGMVLRVKPHPREAIERWRELVGRLDGAGGLRIELADATAEDLLAGVDGVIGMTTMVLLEAHLAQLPVLSLQPARTGIVNPVVDDVTEPVTDAAGAAAAAAAFMARLGSAVPVHPKLQGAVERAGERFADAVEQRVLC